MELGEVAQTVLDHDRDPAQEVLLGLDVVAVECLDGLDEGFLDQVTGVVEAPQLGPQPAAHDRDDGVVVAFDQLRELGLASGLRATREVDATGRVGGPGAVRRIGIHRIRDATARWGSPGSFGCRDAVEGGPRGERRR